MDKFEEVLTKYQNSRFVVVDPMGGKGDKIIYKGMEKKLKELGINFTTLRYKPERAQLSKIRKSQILSHMPVLLQKKAQDVVFSSSKRMNMKKLSKVKDFDVILIRGGAYLNDIWKNYDVLENVLKYNPETIIIAPQSFFFNTNTFEQCLNSVDQTVYVFCREKYSYELLSSLNFRRNIHICLSHDTALYLSKDDFVSKDKNNSEDGSYILICTRKDKESAVDWNVEALRRRTSTALKEGIKRAASPRTCKIIFGEMEDVASFEIWVDMIRGALKVFTDCLHVGTLSAILGKEIFLYPNFYYKNKGVYEFSLHKFPNVRFIDSRRFESEKFF